jgi:clan AA aspartic protease
MMTGRVIQRDALVPVTFRLPGQPNLAVELVVDTGFTEEIALPPTAVTAMGLPHLYDVVANIADDRDIITTVHGAMILWHGSEQYVRVFAIGKRALLGMGLLDGSELVIQCNEGGLVTVDDL